MQLHQSFYRRQPPLLQLDSFPRQKFFLPENPQRCFPAVDTKHHSIPFLGPELLHLGAHLQRRFQALHHDRFEVQFALRREVRCTRVGWERSVVEEGVGVDLDELFQRRECFEQHGRWGEGRGWGLERMLSQVRVKIENLLG